MLQVTASMVSSLFGSATDATNSLIGTIYGTGAAPTTNGDAASAITALKAAQASGAATQGIAQEKRDPVTITALKQFETAISQAKHINTALKDPRVLAVLLPALGLADQLQYPGLVQKALLSDPTATNGLLANIDSRFKTAATTLGLNTKGLAGLKDPSMISNLENGYVQYQYQQGLDSKNAGISDALYFIQNASSETNIYNILGNAVMRRVVTGALGLPQEIAVQSVDTQAAAITSRMPLSDLKDPKKVQLLAQRYVMSQASSDTSGSSAAGGLLSLFG